MHESGVAIALAAALLAAVTGCNNKAAPPEPGKPEKKEYVITLAAENGSAEASVEGVAVTKAAEGTQVTITATADESHIFSKWAVVSGVAAPTDEAARSTTFTMPAENVELRAEFEAKGSLVDRYTITLTGDGGGELSQTEANPATFTMPAATRVRRTIVTTGWGSGWF